VSDGAYLVLACGVALAFVLLIIATTPADNPHVNARRNRRWWTRDPK
jgi:hypothetical protein